MMNRGCNNSLTCPHLGGHEGGVHGLDGPQASVCEHYQQGGQQVTISLLVLFVTFRLFLYHQFNRVVFRIAHCFLQLYILPTCIPRVK